MLIYLHLKCDYFINNNKKHVRQNAYLGQTKNVYINKLNVNCIHKHNAKEKNKRNKQQRVSNVISAAAAYNSNYECDDDDVHRIHQKIQ